MKKFKLNVYKDFKQYFNLLDVLIKTESSNKELFLEEINISPSSYRRVKKDGNKIGDTILTKLAKYFKYNLCKSTLIDEIEIKINIIYFDIYYKDYKNYEDHYKWLEEMINKRYIIFPIFKLFKLLMIVNDKNNPINIQNIYRELYNEVTEYKDFYGKEFEEILEILDVTFKEELDDYYLSNDYVNELTYHTLASRCTVMGRYLESIYFCNVVKNKYFEDENYKRIYFINLILMANYNYLLKFEKSNLLAQKQLLNLESIKNYDLEYQLTKGAYAITCLGLKDYKEVINVLHDKDRLTLTELVSLLISFYNTDIKEYKELYEEYIPTNENSETYKCLVLLDDILHNNKKRIYELDQFNINKCILEILKKCK